MKKSLIIYYSVFHPMILNVKQIFKEGGVVPATKSDGAECIVFIKGAPFLRLGPGALFLSYVSMQS